MIRDILESCGYPPDVLVLDAETYYDTDYTLKKLTTYEYVTDKRFELLGWAIRDSHSLGPDFFREFPMDTPWKNVTVVIHNAPFDALILAHHYGLYPPFIIDTLDLARHIEPRWKNSLAALCERHGLPSKGDTNQFKGLHRSEIPWDELRAYAENDAERTYDLLQLLLPRLSNPKFELEVARYTRDLFLKPGLHFNRDRAIDLKAEMWVEIQKALEPLGMTPKQVRGEKVFKSRLCKALGDEKPPMKLSKKGMILALAKTDAGYEHLRTHPKEPVRRLMEARIAAKSWPLHIRRIENLESIFTCAGGHLPVPLRYYGAHTGRWSGCQKINLHNLPARGHPLIGKIRNLIEAPPGCMLVIADFAQIEARVLDWLADQNDTLQAFREGRQIYCEFASELVGHRIRKPKKTDDPEVAAWHGKYRQMGKIGILGAGYGMGKDRCLEYAKNTYGVELTPAEAKRLIDLYRRTHSMVVLLWEKVEKAFRLATLNTTQAYSLDHGLRFFRDEAATVIELPSTRRLYYTGARVEGTASRPQLTMPNPKAPKHRLPFWGGYLVENCVQAASRDILAETVLKIEELGVRIPLIVHDDMSVVVPEAEVDAYRGQIEDIARTPPTWAPELPVEIECKISREYVK